MRMNKRNIVMVLSVSICLLAIVSVYLLHPRYEDFTKGKSSICSVHAIEMNRQLLPYVYGLPTPGMFEEMDYKKQFPNGAPYAIGGCIPGMHGEKAWFYMCNQCVDARNNWLESMGYEIVLNKKSDTE